MLTDTTAWLPGYLSDECSGLSPVRVPNSVPLRVHVFLEHLISITGEAKWGDRLERIYNALPAT